jgi:hypothetical protein
MQCISDREFRHWLERFGARLNDVHDIQLSSAELRCVLLSAPPKSGPELTRFAAWLTKWLPRTATRALWLKHWHTYPAYQQVIFEKLRSAHSPTRPIGLAPAHLFSPSVHSSSIEESDREQDSELLALILLVLLFDWSAYLLAEGSDDYVYFADERVAFSSTDRGKLEALVEEIQALDAEVEWMKET